MFASNHIRACLLAPVFLALFTDADARRKTELPYDTLNVEFQGATDSLPRVRFSYGDEGFLYALNADLYPTAGDLKAEKRWIKKQAKDLDLFWRFYGDSILASLSTYSGVAWSGGSITVELVRYLSAWELANPPTLPLGGRRRAGIIEAGPSAAERLIQLIHLLAHQLLDRAPRLEYPHLKSALMKRSPYHSENMLNLLALSVAADILHYDAFLETINSPRFARRRPGYELLFSELWGIWTLSQSSPLISHLATEAFDGSVRFRADSSLAAQEIRREVSQIQSHRGLPPGGQLGLALEKVAGGFKVSDADPEKLAFAYGILEGDVIRSVNGLPAKKLREFYRELLNTYEAGGAELRIRRDNNEFTVTIKLAPAGFPDLD
ncbi:MAG: PDZ domain-containing protein [Candidatus Zixiibacteriota bacterium]